MTMAAARTRVESLDWHAPPAATAARFGAVDLVLAADAVYAPALAAPKPETTSKSKLGATLSAASASTQCQLKPGQPAVYRTACTEAANEAACLALSATCDWPGAPGHCILKPNSDPVYVSVCIGAHTHPECDVLSETCVWNGPNINNLKGESLPRNVIL